MPDGALNGAAAPRPRASKVSTESAWELHEGALNAGVQGCRWFVAQVETGRECLAALEMRKRGYGSYVPPEVTRVRYPTGTVYTSRRALICGYVFVRFAPDRMAWHPIEEAFWVVRLVRIGDRPQPMPPGTVEEIRREAQKREAEALGSPARWKDGQRLRITDGPLMGLEGLFLGGDAQKVTLLLDILGGRPVQDIPDAIVALA